MNSTIEPSNLNEEMNEDQIERTISSENENERTTAPFGASVTNRRFLTLRNARHTQYERNIIESSPQLQQLFSEIEFLRCNLEKLTTDLVNTKKRSCDVSKEMNALFSQLVEQKKYKYKTKIAHFAKVSPQLQQLCSENEFLTSNLREIRSDILNTQNQISNVENEINALFRQLSQQKKEDKTKLKIVSCVKAKKELFSKMETHCGICLEHHEYSDVCTLPCNHEFGTNCFENWFTRGSQTCPECRNPTQEIKTFRLHAENLLKKKIEQIFLQKMTLK